MQYCLARMGFLPFLIRAAFTLFDTFTAFSSARPLTVAKNPDESRHPNSREVINQQAERLLADYGNTVLRMAYSYLHNTEDAEEILQDTLVQFLKAAPTLESRHMRRHGFSMSPLIYAGTA